MLHPIQRCLIHNSKFQGFTTVQQTLSNITQIFPAYFKDKPCSLTNIPLNYLNLLHISPILALTDIYYIYTYTYIHIHIYIYIYIYIYIDIEVSAYPQKHQPFLFFAKPLINQKTVKAPPLSPSPLANLSLYILVFCKTLQNQIFQ